MNKREENAAGMAIAMVPAIMFVMAIAFAIAMANLPGQQADPGQSTTQPSADSGS